MEIERNGQGKRCLGVKLIRCGYEGGEKDRGSRLTVEMNDGVHTKFTKFKYERQSIVPFSLF